MKFAALILWLASCARPAPVPDPPELGDRSDLRSVAITSPCGMGSGVIVGPRHVVTALHVVACPIPGAFIAAGDDVYFAGRDIALEQHDIARLELVEDDPRALPYDGKPAVADAVIGEGACVYAPVPERKISCGKVTGVNATTVAVDAAIRKGNSGSGTYNERGELVGIVRSCFLATAGGNCSGRGGLATSLAEIGWVVP